MRRTWGPQGPERSPSRHWLPSDGPRTRISAEGRKSPMADPHLDLLVRKELPWGASHVEGSALEATQHPACRFLKQKPSNKASSSGQQARPNPAPQGGLGVAVTSASKGRPSSLLQRVAQIERRVQSRRSQQREAGAAARLAAILDSAAKLSLSESSGGDSERSDSERRAGGHQWRAKKGEGKAGTSRLTNTPLQDPAKATEGISQRAPEKEVAVEAGGSSELWPDRKAWIQTPAKMSPLSAERALPGKNPLKRASRTPASPPGQRASLGPLSRRGTSSSSPSLQGSLSADPTAEGPSPYERSIIRSLDELFSEATDAHGSDDDNTISGSDFQVNILSLDDLVPAGASQEEEEEEMPLQVAGKPGKELTAVLHPPPPPAAVTSQSIFSAQKANNGKGLTSEEKEAELLGEMVISEQVGSSSAALSSSSGKDETPGDAEYSEDFEPSSLSFVASEVGEGQSLTSSGELQSHSKVSLQSCRLGSSSLQSPRGRAVSTKRYRRSRTVKEAAVQTSSSLHLPQWWQTDVPIIGLAMSRGCTVDAMPVSSPTLSLDALEALTVYSPAAFALNELLKENLLLIRQFAEANHRLHASLVASLEEEEFHYHTLEEAQRYIKNHKAPSLTIEQALQEMAEQEEVDL